jgi:hypothetical protein
MAFSAPTLGVRKQIGDHLTDISNSMPQEVNQNMWTKEYKYYISGIQIWK